MLEVKDLSANYGNDGDMILHRLNAVFAQHGISFVVGANGVGKTLLLKILADLHAPKSGNIIRDSKKLPALLHQTPILLNRSVRDNLRFIAHSESQGVESHHGADDNNVQDVLSKIGLQAQQDKNALWLSGGQKKLLSFGFLLLMKRDYWLLDEPTASLAKDAKIRIENLIIQAREAGQKIVMVSHDMAQIESLAQQEDDILFLNAGNHDMMGTTIKAHEFFKLSPAKQATYLE